MLKRIAIVCALALSFTAASGTPPAQADIRLYFGIPHYPYYAGPGYIYRPGYGWYLPPRQRLRYSCDDAIDIIRDRGYRRIAVRDCSGRQYVFRAWRGDRRYTLYFDARTGRLRRG